VSQHANPGDLNAQQMRFVAEYVRDLHATKAAIRAGYSPRTAG
jgi:phage terminase small subunit